MESPMNRLHTLRVRPTLPEKLENLRAIAHDLHWCWNHDAIDLFRRIDQEVWKKCEHNPVRLLAEVSQERLEEVAQDDGFLSHFERVWTRFEQYCKERTWYQSTFADHKNLKIAYFSAEFGIHECLPIYSGGLGILAGDHLKAASDLGIPLVGVGLSYQRGYFRQYLNADGWQQERYPENEMFFMPISLVRDKNGEPLECTLRIGWRDVILHIWKIKLGRIDLYLLDTNVMNNAPEDRKITENLYGGNQDVRIQQEIVLGIGGIIALEKLGIKATVFHMNEGHSAFLALERIRRLMVEEQLTFEEAREAARASQVFTTHTPVPAGIDRFSLDLMDKYFKNYWTLLGLDRTQFFALGGADPKKSDSSFNMAILALQLSAFTNGVSRLHGEVSRGMWQSLWRGCLKSEIPIGSITNGVHAPSWVSDELRMILDRELGPRWEESPFSREHWSRVRNISSEELCRMRDRLRARLVIYSRRRLQQQLKQRDASVVALERARDVLDMNTLTIGFARRFATYKRAALLFRDKQRLASILSNPKKPVQLIFAGKAHPQDDPGKQIIREIVHFAREDEMRSRIVFLEDYDIHVARHLVQGCDVWLNTPRRPHEASGTSGMKAAVNGVLNCSTLDGWWAEAYNPEIGWAIGQGETYDDLDYQDQIESEALYDILEDEIIPLFYKRDRLNVAREWAETIKKMLEAIFPVYVTTRMVDEYTKKAYLPCYNRMQRLREDNYQPVKNLTQWIEKIQKNWETLSILNVHAERSQNLRVGDQVAVETTLKLGNLVPSDIRVEAALGQLAGDRDITDISTIPLSYESNDGDGNALFKGQIPCITTGHFGYAIRVLPFHKDLSRSLDLGLVIWEP